MFALISLIKKIMKNNKGFIGLGLILAIIAVLVVGGGAYYLGTKNASQLVRNQDQNNQPIQIPATWKTYRNTKYGYEVSFPQDSTLLVENNGLVGNGMGDREVKEFSPTEDYISITDNLNQLIFEISKDKTDETNADNKITESVILDSKKYQAIGFYDSNDHSGTGTNYTIKALTVNFPSFQIRYGFGNAYAVLDSKSVIKYDTLVNQILSTFRLIK
jgi:hypothetical protein